MTASFEALLGATRVVPVITIERRRERPCRSPRRWSPAACRCSRSRCAPRPGIESISRIAARGPGRGRRRGHRDHPQQLLDARNAGAQFIVSPGCTDALAAAAADAGGVFLPGAVTASEVLRLLEHGISLMKFFPAETSGGVAALKALGGPFPQVSFCPTGGIDLERAPSYLALPNVVCIGGSWMVPADLIAAGDWDAIRALAAEASAATSASVGRPSGGRDGATSAQSDRHRPSAARADRSTRSGSSTWSITMCAAPMTRPCGRARSCAISR